MRGVRGQRGLPALRRADLRGLQGILQAHRAEERQVRVTPLFLYYKLNTSPIQFEALRIQNFHTKINHRWRQNQMKERRYLQVSLKENGFYLIVSCQTVLAFH